MCGNDAFPSSMAVMAALAISPLASLQILRLRKLLQDSAIMPIIGNRVSSESVAAMPTPPEFASMIQDLSASELSKTARRFSRSTEVPFRGTSRSQKYRKEEKIGECPKGQNYYICQSTGFKGCCSKNACDPDVKCPESSDTISTKESNSPDATSTDSSSASSTGHSSVEATSVAPEETSSTKSETRSVKSSLTSAARSPSDAVLNATSIRATADVALAPSCPKGNGTTYTDNNNITYVVHCASDNSAASYNSVQVSIGGYGQCFSSCSESSDCAGFTHVGLDDGICYLKSTMPKDTYINKAGNNYISCAKVNPSQSASQPTATPAATSRQPNKGAIAGGVVGGIAIIGLVLFLIAYITRRRRQEAENKRATLTHIFGGAVEPGRHDDGTDNSHTLPLHHRSGSTSHDIFAPYGGFYRGAASGSISRDYAHQSNATSNTNGEAGLKGAWPHPPAPPSFSTPYPETNSVPFDAKSPAPSSPPYTLPSTTYQPQTHMSPEHEPVPLLDSTEVMPRSASRSPRFHEHISELEDTSSPPPPVAAGSKRWGSVLYADGGTQKPTNGREEMLDEARRRQQRLHLMSLDAYGESMEGAGIDARMEGAKARPGERGDGGGGWKEIEGEVSPDSSGSPLDRGFVVSPMGSLDGRRA